MTYAQTHYRLGRHLLRWRTRNLSTQRAAWLLMGMLAVCAAIIVPAEAASVWRPEPSWAPTPVEPLRAEMISLIGQRVVDSSQRDAWVARWQALPDAEPEAALDLAASTAAAVHDESAALVAACQIPSRPADVPDVAWLQDADLPKILRNNLRLFAARWFMQEAYYDEALDLVADLSPQDVVDPAALLFCKAVCHHQLVEVKPATSAAEMLLERESEIPTRFEQLARLISEDVEEVEEGSLDHISRRMNDVRRRLENGRAGQQVILVEDGVIASLDKLIEDLEEQGKGDLFTPGGGGQSPARPMDESMLPTGPQGPGNVERRNVGDGSGWGALDDKDREEALQEVGREFPSHYRDVIEEYFKKIAAEEDAEP